MSAWFIINKKAKNGDTMYKIKIMCDFLSMPLWAYDDDGYTMPLPEIIAEDPEINDISTEMDMIFSSACDFSGMTPIDLGALAKSKERMLELTASLNRRLEELNDGSYVVIDLETPRFLGL